MQRLIYYTLIYSSLVLFCLPIFGCLLVDCKPYEGQLSVSSLLHSVPLATWFSFFGALFLFCVFSVQIKNQSIYRTIFSFIGIKALSVPLLVPLQTLSDNFHLGSACIGFVFQLFFTALIIAEMKTKKIPRGTGLIYSMLIVQVVCALVGAIALSLETTDFSVYAIVVSEYVFGLTILIVT